MYTISTKHKYIHQVLEGLIKQERPPSSSSPSSSVEEACSPKSDHLPSQNNILIICSTRDEFLNQLEACINHEVVQHQQQEQEQQKQHSTADADTEAELRTLTSPSSRHVHSGDTTTTPPTKKVDEIPASQEDLGEALTRHHPTVPATSTTTTTTNTTTSNITDNNDNSPLRPPTTPNHYTHPFQSQPTLYLLSTSSQIKVVFCPNITTFRAYTSTLPFQLNSITSLQLNQTETNTNTQATPRTKNKPPTATTTSLPPLTKASPNQTTRITIINLLSLHNHTSEFSLQGLSRTLSNLITSTSALTKPHIPPLNLPSTNTDLTAIPPPNTTSNTITPSHTTSTTPSRKSNHNLVNINLIECTNIFDPTDHTNHGNALWDAKVPLLSGSVRVSEEGRKWVAGREVKVRDVVLRWFDFESENES